MAQIPNKMAAEIADIAKKKCFCFPPLPQQIVFDRGTKFMAEFAKMCQNDYGLKGPYKIPRKRKTRLNCGALQRSILPQAGSRWHKYPIKRLQKLQISPRKLGLLVTHFHSELCLIAVPNLWLNLPKCVKMTMA